MSELRHPEFLFKKRPFLKGVKLKLTSIYVYTNAHYASIEYSMKEDVE